MAAICGFAALAALWLHPGAPLRTKLMRSIVMRGRRLRRRACLATQVRTSIDVTEDRRNSFPAADQRVLATLREPLVVTVHLAPEDPRYVDLRRNVLAKLERALPDVSHSARHERPKRRRQQQRRALTARSSTPMGPRRQEPLDQPSRNPAAALRLGGHCRPASGHRGGLSRLPAGRQRTTDPAVVPRRPPGADRPRLVVEPPPTPRLPAQLIKEEVKP